MHIVFIAHGTISKNAAIKRAFGMTPWLLQMGVKVSIICEETGENRRAALPSGGKLVTYPLASAPGEVWYKARLLCQLSPDLVYLCGVGWRNVILCLLGGPIRFVVEHSELTSEIKGVPRMAKYGQRILEFAAKHGSSGSVAASRYLYEYLRKGATGPVQYLRYGADPVKKRPAASGGQSLHGFGRYLLYVGSLFRNYGVWVLLSAAEIVARHRNDFVLVFSGTGPEVCKMRAWVGERNLSSRIHLVGFVPEEQLSILMYEAEALIAPLSDTVADRARCPSKIPLYMMAGRPIVTCRIGEAVEYLGDNAYYYRPDDVASLAGVLAALWGKAGTEKCVYSVNSVTWQEVAKRFHYFWSQMCASSPRLI